MYKRSIGITLLIYLGYSMFVSSVLSIIVLLIEYSPSAQREVERFGIGALVLDCIFWGLLFTLTGSLSFLNINRFIQKNFIFSLLSFILLPAIAFVIVILARQTTELFGAVQTSLIFLGTQIFFFFRFRSCIRDKTVLPAE